MIVPAKLRYSCLTLLLLLAVNELYAQRAATPVTFRTNAQMVLIPVTVTDHNGKTALRQNPTGGPFLGRFPESQKFGPGCRDTLSFEQ